MLRIQLGSGAQITVDDHTLTIESNKFILDQHEFRHISLTIDERLAKLKHDGNRTDDPISLTLGQVGAALSTMLLDLARGTRE